MDTMPPSEGGGPGSIPGEGTMTSRFKKVDEDFVCGNCGQKVSGDGYTNHCPACLWSKHVDNFPGDRSADCGGMMRPIGLDLSSKEEDIIHRCEVCRHEKRNKVQKGDDREAIISLSSETYGSNG